MRRVGLFDVVLVEPPVEVGGGVRLSEFQTKWRLLLVGGGRVAAEAYTLVERGPRSYLVTAYILLEPRPGVEPAWLPSYETCSLGKYRIGDAVEGAVLAGVAGYGVTEVFEREAAISPQALERLRRRGAVERWEGTELVRVEAPQGALTITVDLREGGGRRPRISFELKHPARTLEEADRILDEALRSLLAP